MRTIYKVFKKNFPLHALGRIGFQSDKYSFRGLENENKNYFTVISDCPCPSISNLKVIKEEEKTDYKDGEAVGIVTSVCFEDRKSNKKVYQKEALLRFLERTGLKEKEAKCEFAIQMDIVKRKFPIDNCFDISGKFEVVDSGKFKEALEKGIGGRGSYGFGLIQIV